MSTDQWFHPAISSSVTPFSSCPQSFPAPVSRLFASSGGQRIGASASASVLPMTVQSWFPLGLTGLISLQSKGSSRVFSSTTVWKHQSFGAQSSLWPNSHICTRLLGKPRSQSLSPVNTWCPWSPPHPDINNSFIATTVTSQNSTDHSFTINFGCLTFKFVFHSKQKTSWGQNRLLFIFVPTVPSTPASPWGYTVTAERQGACMVELRRVGSVIWWINVPLTKSQQPFSYLNRTVSAAPGSCFQCSSYFCWPTSAPETSLRG